MMSIHVRLGKPKNVLAGFSFDYSISTSFVFFFALSTSPDVRDLFTFGLGEFVAPVDDWGAVFVESEVFARSAGPSTPDGRKNEAPCIEEDCRKSVPTPAMLKIRLFTSLEESLLDFFDCLVVREAVPVDDIECGRIFFDCSLACWSMLSGGAASVFELEAWKRSHDGKLDDPMM